MALSPRHEAKNGLVGRPRLSKARAVQIEPRETGASLILTLASGGRIVMSSARPEGGFDQEEQVMPRKAKSALDALARHEQQQQIAREAGETLRRAAACELGLIVLEAGGDLLGIDGVRSAIEKAVASKRVRPGADRASAEMTHRG